MTKKFLNLILCFAQILIVFVFVSVDTKAAENIAATDGYFLFQDFEDSSYTDFTDAVRTRVQEDNGNYYMDFKVSAQTALRKNFTDVKIPSTWVITFDICKTSSPSYAVGFDVYDCNREKRVFKISPASLELGVWYTYAVVADDNNVFRAYRKERDSAEELEATSIITQYPLHSVSSPVNDYGSLLFVLYQSAGAEPGFSHATTGYGVDNIGLYKNSFIDNMFFEDENGNEIHQIPQGKITGTAKLVSDAFDSKGIDKATVVMTAFDGKGNVVAAVTEEKTLAALAVQEISASLDLNGVDNVKGVELSVWDSPESMKPLVEKICLGETPMTEGSYTTAQMGETTEITDRENNFAYLDRSTFADSITVEGKTDTGVASDITVLVKGQSDGNVVFARQITTMDDGSFKFTFGFGQELIGNDSGIEIVFSGATINPQKMSIDIASDWEGFSQAFLFLDTADEAITFFEDYDENLSYLTSGVKEPVKIDVSGLTENDWGNFAFLKSVKSYDELTCGEIVYEVKSLIEKLDGIAPFIKKINNAKNGEDTLEQKAKAIKEILVGEDAPIDFDYGATSNKGAVCNELAKYDDFANIKGLYDAFAYECKKQSELEDSALDGFKSISSGETARQFFAGENGITLGITADSLAYNTEEWNTFFEGYAENNCADVENAGEMNESITELCKYVEDVREFCDNIYGAGNAVVLKSIFEKKYDANSFMQKKLLALKDEGMNSSDIGNIEMFYEKLFTEVKIQEAFVTVGEAAKVYADVKSEQIGLEKDGISALISALTAEDVKNFFDDYGNVFGFAEKEFIQREAEIFAELNVKKGADAKTYSDAVETLMELTEKTEKSIVLLDSMAEMDKVENWEGMKALFEGNEFSELVFPVNTENIVDLRSLYKRIISKECNYFNLSEVTEVFSEAHSEQLEWEQTKGSYETSNNEKAYFEESVWSFDVMANVIRLSGKVDTNGSHNLVIAVTVGEQPILVKQIETEGNGSFDTLFVLNPDTQSFPAYKAGADMAKIKIVSNTVNTYRLPLFDLYSEEDILGVVTDFKKIAKAGSENKQLDLLDAFVKKYGDMLKIKGKINEAIGVISTDDSYEKNKKKVYEAMLFVYNKHKDGYSDISDISEIVNGADGKSGTVAILEEMERIVNLLDDMTKAANEKVGGTTGRWGLLWEYVNAAKENGWISPKESTDKMSAKQIEKTFLQMAGKEYTSLEKVETEFDKAALTVLNEKTERPSDGGSGGSGGGSSMAIGGGLINTNGKVEIIPEKAPAEPFNDISDVVWARDAIDGLRRYSIVKGDGDGTYRPNDTISREEFLAILFRLFEVSADDKAPISFTDVDGNAWYADVVATAQKTGIVKGYGDGRFGIGDNISRADMAVMIQRMANYCGLNLLPVKKRIIFNDYGDIPEYAFEDIYALQQADILKGDNDGNFNPKADVTRAEAAVAFWGVFGKIKNVVTYSWADVY